jgi:phosphoglycerate dehydrogenase-like enzyme
MASSFAQRKIGEPQGMALKGRTVGLVGLGGIGRALIRRLRGYGVRLIGIRRTHPETARDELGLDWAGGPGELPRLLGESDFVVLCLPATAETRGLINDEAFAAMKSNAFLINLSRGGLVERDALEKALVSGAIAGAGLDVYWEEPVDPADPIFRHNVFTTPHIGGSTDISMRGITRVVAENIRRVEKGLKPHHMK